MFIDGTSYVLRDMAVGFRHFRAYTDIPTQRLERLEERLVHDLVLEKNANSGHKILVHSEKKRTRSNGENHDGGAESLLANANLDTGNDRPCDLDLSSFVIRNGCLEPLLTSCNHIESPKTAITSIDRETVLYGRVAMSGEGFPRPFHFDHIYKIVKGAVPLDCHIHVQSRRGSSGRSAVGMAAVAVVLEHIQRMKEKNTEPLHKELNAPLPGNASSVGDIDEFSVIKTLVRVTVFGHEARLLCDGILREHDPFPSPSPVLRKEIFGFLKMSQDEGLPQVLRRRAFRRHTSLLGRLFLLIAFQACLLEKEKSDSNGGLDEDRLFSSWMEGHPELVRLYEEDLCKGKFVAATVRSSLAVDENTSVVRGRSGVALTCGMMLKEDHFPGCQSINKNDATSIKGAPNYRKKTAGITVAGLAIPRLSSIGQVIRTSLASIKDGGCGGDSGPLPAGVVWVNLREEPVLYVKNVPFVLRDISRPNDNLITTGISQQKVEWMEEKMKADVLDEIGKYNGRLLLHGESSSGDPSVKTTCMSLYAACGCANRHTLYIYIRLHVACWSLHMCQ